jgi:epoxyqueuosine reductase QueG
VSPEAHEFASPDEAAQHLRGKALGFGADIVGICAIEPSDVYRGRTVIETFAIAVGQRMRWREFQVVPSRESAIECLRVYFTLGETVIRLADYIRSLGHACRVEHPIGDSDLLHIPIGLKAGFGELGRHGSIIHPKLGPLFRMGSVATSIPLTTDRPIDAGIAAFCDRCRACRKYCPADAIPDERSPEAGKDHLGYDRYVVDTGRCFPYFAKHSYCSICLPVCAYNHKDWARDFEGFQTALFPNVLMTEPPLAVDPQPKESVHWYPRLNR